MTSATVVATIGETVLADAHPIGAGEFRVEEVGAILVFEGEAGPASAAVLKHAGQEMRANRVAE